MTFYVLTQYLFNMETITKNIWEEENLIEPLKKLENKPIFDQNNGIKETRNEFAKNEYKNIGNKNKWIRNCPKCNKEIIYFSKHGFDDATYNNKRCRSCINTNSLRTKISYVD